MRKDSNDRRRQGWRSLEANETRLEARCIGGSLVRWRPVLQAYKTQSQTQNTSALALCGKVGSRPESPQPVRYIGMISPCFPLSSTASLHVAGWSAILQTKRPPVTPRVPHTHGSQREACILPQRRHPSCPERGYARHMCAQKGTNER